MGEREGGVEEKEGWVGRSIIIIFVRVHVHTQN